MNKGLLFLLGATVVGGGIWLASRIAAAGCMAGVTECRGGDLWVCGPIVEGEILTNKTQWMLFEANSIYCSSAGARGSIYGVTITPQEEPVDDVLVMVVNQDLNVSEAWLTQYSKCPAAPGARVSRGLGVPLTDAERRLRHGAGPLPVRGTGQGLGALPECYRFDNLPVGTYTVFCLHTGYITSEKQAVVTEGEQTFVVSTMVAE